MPTHPIVVVGASAGGIEALQGLVAGLPHDFPATICVVLHLHAYSTSHLPDILGRVGQLPAVHPHDGERMEEGHIYIAPPDHHLLVEGDRLGVKKGPKENRFRPSVDALFRSAAYTRAPGVIGVVLSGVLDDGTSGLWTIKRLGGTAVVQDPGEATFDGMPLHALEQVDVDYRLRVGEMGPLLTRLVREGAREPREVTVDEQERERLGLEVQMAASGPPAPMSVRRLGEFSPFTCPECHGVLVQFQEGGKARFRCHTGHAYTATALMSELSESIEDQLYQTLRAMEEGIVLLGQLGRQAGALNTAQLTALLGQARQVQQRADVIHRMALEQEAVGRGEEGRVGG